MAKRSSGKTEKSAIPRFERPKGIADDMWRWILVVTEILSAYEGEGKTQADSILTRHDLSKIGIDPASLNSETATYDFRDNIINTLTGGKDVCHGCMYINEESGGTTIDLSGGSSVKLSTDWVKHHSNRITVDASSGHIEIIEDGLYNIKYDMSLYATAGPNREIEAELFIDGSAAGIAEAHDELGGLGDPLSLSASAYEKLAKGNELSIYLKDTQGSPALEVELFHSHFIVTKVN